MAAYLKIENPGVCPPEGFTVLGVSLADTSNNRGVIGQFGSGNKHAVNVLLRNEISPVVFSGTLKMEFFTKEQTVSDTKASKDFARVCVKYGGSDPITGSSRTSTEDLGFVLDYGQHDWDEVALALREFVSNAIDRSIREQGDFSAVKVEVVDEKQVRAKRDHTRVFIPLTPDVLKFYTDLGKWFLHFSEPGSLEKAILPKRNRNLGERQAAVIYRRGVRVREFTSSNAASLFDYNLDNLRLDEARKASDWDVKHSAGRALAGAGKEILAVYFDRLLNGNTSFWEFTFDEYSLEPGYSDTEAAIDQRKKNWSEAFHQIAGDTAVLTSGQTADQLHRKGFRPVQASEAVIAAGSHYGVQTAAVVLSADERDGRKITDASPDAQAAVDYIWSLIESCGLTNGKSKPPVRCFTAILDGGVMINGFYRDGVVHINADLGGTSTEFGGSLSNRLLKVALEEVAHHATDGATDNSRDFQDYLLQLVIKLSQTRQHQEAK